MQRQHVMTTAVDLASTYKLASVRTIQLLALACRHIFSRSQGDLLTSYINNAVLCLKFCVLTINQKIIGFWLFVVT